MATNTQKMIVELSAKVDQYNREIQSAMEKTESGGRKGARSLRDVEQSAVNLNKMGSAALLKFAGVAAAAFSVAKMQAYADEYTSLQNRIRTVIDPTQDLATVTGELLAVANDTRGSITATSELYSKLKRNTDDLGLSQSDLLGVTSTINKAFAISGATTAEATGSIRQLAQALASGALRGDEFNSVAEGAPIIMEAISKATGKTKGELRDLAADGRISAEILIGSLQAYAEVIDNDFSKANMTAAQAQEQLNNNFIVFLGELDKSMGMTESTVSSMKLMSDALIGMQGPILEIIESVKDFRDVVANNLKSQEGDLRDLAATYENELAFMKDLLGAFAWAVETGLLSVPVIIQAAVTQGIANVAYLIEAGQIKIMEFRKWLAELQGNDDVADIIQTQIDAMGTAAADTWDMVTEQTKEKLANLKDIVAENDKEMNDARIARLNAQNEAEIALLTERLEREAAIKAEFEEGGLGELLDEESPAERKKREEKEASDLHKSLLKMRSKDEKDYEKNRLKSDRIISKSNEKMEKGKLVLAGTVVNGLATMMGANAKTTFLINQGLAAGQTYVSTMAGAMRAYADLGPIAGPPAAAAIVAQGNMAMAAIAATTIFGAIGGGGGGGGVGGSVGGGEQGAEINTTPIEPEATSTLDVSIAGGEGSTTNQMIITAPPGDSIGEMLAEWINEGIKKGRIG